MGRKPGPDEAPKSTNEVCQTHEVARRWKGSIGPYTVGKNVVAIALYVFPNCRGTRKDSELDHRAKRVDRLLGRVQVELKLVHQVEILGDAKDKPDQRVGMVFHARFTDCRHVRV